jgi:U3 small nucleolar RNA-associated protein 20
VYRIMRTQMLPSLRNLLLKQVKDKHGGRVQVLRAPVALAILKIIRLLPPSDFDMQLTRLLMAVCVALRSRDSTAREGARGVYCQMLTDLGPDYLPTFLHQLCAALKEGYQLHVRLFTLHAMLRTLAEHYAPPTDAPSYPISQPDPTGPPIAEPLADGEAKPEIVRPPLDSCIKEMLDLLLEDLFGELGAAKESEADVKSATIREAKGQKALDCLELLGRLILFRPTYAVGATDGDPAAVSSVHALVSPLLWQMHDSESPKIHAKYVHFNTRIALPWLSVGPVSVPFRLHLVLLTNALCCPLGVCGV